jgi:membrane associated rhomboid family serine protease
MLSRTIVSSIIDRPPYITLSLLAATLVTTLPQFFLPDLYDTLTGSLFGLRPPHYVLLHVFSHSPSILIPHFLGNILVLLFFGSISETLLGRRRFAVLTLVTLGVTVATAYARSVSSIHGLSGVIWGYHVPVLFLVIATAQRRASLRALLGDPLVPATLVLFLFDFLGLHLLELFVLGLRPFENFGQVIHMVSLVVAMPFAYAWREQIEKAALAADRGEGLQPAGEEAKRVTHPVFLLLGGLLLLNLLGTAHAVVTTQNFAGSVSYTVRPPKGSPAPALLDGATITFSKEMLPREPTVRRRSIWYHQAPPPEVRFSWVGKRSLAVTLSRGLTKEEALLLKFDVYLPGPAGITLPVTVELSYGSR